MYYLSQGLSLMWGTTAFCSSALLFTVSMSPWEGLVVSMDVNVFSIMMKLNSVCLLQVVQFTTCSAEESTCRDMEGGEA